MKRGSLAVLNVSLDDMGCCLLVGRGGVVDRVRIMQAAKLAQLRPIRDRSRADGSCADRVANDGRRVGRDDIGSGICSLSDTR